MITRASRHTPETDRNASATLSKIQKLEAEVKLCQSHNCLPLIASSLF